MSAPGSKPVRWSLITPFMSWTLEVWNETWQFRDQHQGLYLLIRLEWWYSSWEYLTISNWLPSSIARVTLVGEFMMLVVKHSGLYFLKYVFWDLGTWEERCSLPSSFLVDLCPSCNTPITYGIQSLATLMQRLAQSWLWVMSLSQWHSHQNCK